MANEFIARKGLIALEDSQITGSLSVSSDITGNGKLSLSEGTANLHIGLGATSSGAHNTIVGINAGKEVNIQYNTLIGNDAGSNANSGIYKTFLGHSAGTNNTGNYSIAIGATANRFSSGLQSIGIGYNALYNDGALGSNYSIAIGGSAGYAQSGTHNILLGQESAYNIIGNYNTVLGYQAGYNASGSTNVIIGYQAGYNLTGSNQLVIANNSSSALIEGDFANETVTISGSLSITDKVTGSLTVESSGSTIFEIIGSEGQLFSITDSLSGSLFAVSDVSGLPILEVFSDDTVKIGSFNAEAIIVTGSTATISGSFSGSFQGNGSNLTGLVTPTGTPSDNQIAVFTNSTTIEGDSNFTWDGVTLSTPSITFADRDTGSIYPVSLTSDGGVGDIIKLGSTSGLTAGDVYYWNGAAWAQASCTNAATSSLVAVAAGTNSGTDGMILRGIVQTGDTLTSGAPAYLISTAGRVGPTAPSTTGQAVRIMGYALGTEEMYFDPSPNWITLA